MPGTKRRSYRQDPTAVPLGYDENGVFRFLKQAFRTLHGLLTGTTGVGKTESVVAAFVIQDIKNGCGILLMDGKSERAFLEKIYAYVVAYGREKDFCLFSLSNIASSMPFNPLEGGSPHEVVERVFASFKFENEYYRNVQYKLFLSIVQLIHEKKVTPTFCLVQRLLTDMAALKLYLKDCQDENLSRTLTAFSMSLRDPQSKD